MPWLGSPSRPDPRPLRELTFSSRPCTGREPVLAHDRGVSGPVQTAWWPPTAGPAAPLVGRRNRNHGGTASPQARATGAAEATERLLGPSPVAPCFSPGFFLRRLGKRRQLERSGFFPFIADDS